VYDKKIAPTSFQNEPSTRAFYALKGETTVGIVPVVHTYTSESNNMRKRTLVLSFAAFTSASAMGNKIASVYE
jgi:hypothetical protein